MATKYRPEKASLSGVSVKLDRAHEHLEALDSELSTFFEANPYRTLAKLNPHTGEYVMRLRVRKEPPPRWGAIVGDFIHNSRSALDHVAWKLVEHGPHGLPSDEETRRQISYPVAFRDTQFRGSVTVQRVGQGARDVMEQIQPYKRADRPEIHPLAVLNELWNFDKHRFLHPHWVKSADETPELTLEGPASLPGLWADWAVGTVLEDGAEVLKFRIPPLRIGTYDAAWGVHIWQEPSVKMQGKLPVDVAFGKPWLQTTQLGQLDWFVRVLVERLEPFLP